ncbi:WGR domain-containing protein [Bacillus benzoevorans]|uniref:NAD(+) ADP-ribosyltransferase n=1 Tax=Bacillus benzoevorans TaxID=1456 RepID=A0A7X0LW06_9BACI|nr:WGR domain-containing protein [Bacillus benzoevorans]MBB6446188.1 poly [ADP-ribose] polymerase [Bacillus benzoevorans]
MINTSFPYVKDTPSFAIKQVEQRVVLNYVSFLGNSNKFYVMEFHEGSGEYTFRIYTEYGRLGRPPRKQERYFQTRFKAKKEFDRILSSKRKKGYEIIVIDEEWDELFLNPIRTPYQGKMIHPYSQAPTISLQTPLGNLSEIQLHRGLQILTEIEEKLHNGSTNDVIALSNQFYSVIPVVFESQIDRSFLLDHLEKVKETKEKLGQMILEIHY